MQIVHRFQLSSNAKLLSACRIVLNKIYKSQTILKVKFPHHFKDHFLFVLKVQQDVASILQVHFSPDGLVVRCLEYAMTQEHIMDFTRLRALSSLFSMLNQGVRLVLSTSFRST